MKNIKKLMVVCMMVGALSGCSLPSEALGNDDSVELIILDEIVIENDSDPELSLLESLNEAVDKATGKNYPTEDNEVDEIITLSGTEDLIIIDQAGSYLISGNLNGQLLVDVGDEDVQLILAGVEIQNSQSSPIYIKSADEATITLKNGTENIIINRSVYIEDTEDETVERVNGAIYSKADLAINGSGTLIVEGNDNTGILSKDDLVILGGTLNISSDRHAIKGKDLLYVDEASITVSAGKDGLNSEVLICVDGGTIEVTDAYEGMEAYDIIINAGQINIQASDDGINIADPDSVNIEPMQGQRPEQIAGEERASSSEHGLYINGGQLIVDTNSDGLDSNANIWMTGGEVLVNGTSDYKNGAIDYDYNFTLTGGVLIAGGSAKMAQGPSEGSTQLSLSINFDETYDANTLVEIKDASGQVILDYTSVRAFQSLVTSSDDYEENQTYTIEVNGVVVETVELSETITEVGAFSEEGPGGFGQKPDLGEGAGPGQGRKPLGGMEQFNGERAN